MRSKNDAATRLGYLRLRAMFNGGIIIMSSEMAGLFAWPYLAQGQPAFTQPIR